MDVAHGLEVRDHLREQGFRLLPAVQADEGGRLLREPHDSLVLPPERLLFLEGHIGIFQRFLVLAFGVEDLGGHPVQDGHAGRIIGLGGVLQRPEDVFLPFLRLVAGHVDAGDRVQGRTDAVRIAGLLVQHVALPGVIRGLGEIRQPDIAHGEEVQAVRLEQLGVVPFGDDRQRLFRVFHGVGIVLQVVIPVAGPVPDMGGNLPHRGSRREDDGLVRVLLLLEQGEERGGMGLGRVLVEGGDGVLHRTGPGGNGKKNPEKECRQQFFHRGTVFSTQRYEKLFVPL